MWRCLSLLFRRRERQWYTCPVCGNEQNIRGFCANERCPDPFSIVVPD